MRILQIGADRSKRGILYPGTPAFKRQEAYAKKFGHLDIVAFSRKKDGAKFVDAGALQIFPTSSLSRLLYTCYAVHIARTLPKPDVVSAQDPFETGLTAWLIARIVGVPLHVQVHTDFLSSAYAQLSPMNRIRVWLAGFVLRRAARIRVVSERIRKSLEGSYHLSGSISVLPIFADIERVRGAADASITSRFNHFGTRVLVVSRLEPEKNVALALGAFLSAPKDSCLIIVGEGSERSALQGQARTAGIAERVFFEGEHDSAPYYSLADLVLCTSRYEGYGLVIAEALAAGKPVLSNDVGIAREAGAIVTSDKKFADTLKQWFADGPRTGELKGYPYKNFDEYVQAYCDDIISCASGQKR